MTDDQGESLMRKALAALALAVMTIPQTGSPALCDWTMYGHDLAHSFQQDEACSAVDTANVARLVPKWFFHTSDSVTASPAIVDATVYVGTWQGRFYALDAETGTERWHYDIGDGHGVAFGRIVSSANVTQFPDRNGDPTKVVLFGGGGTLYALSTAGTLLASLDIDPRTDRSADATIEIESSPAVADIALGNLGVRRTIFVGMDVHNDAHVGRTGLLALTLAQSPDGTWTLDPVWKFDPETRQTYTGAGLLTQGAGGGFGCGGVWSSPAVDVVTNTVAFGTSNCENPEAAKASGETWSEAMWAIDARDGSLAWYTQPASDFADAHADDDFGASPNIFTPLDGTRMIGEGRKSAQYFARSLDGASGWVSLAGQPGHLNDDFALGGFLGTTAVQTSGGVARRIIGATAFPVPRPDQDFDVTTIDRSTWAVRAIDPASGSVAWTYRLGGPSYGATTIVNGVAFVPDTFSLSLLALDTSTGGLLWAAPVPGAPSSAIVPVGDSIYAGVGTRETDAEFKAFGSQLQDLFANTVGPHPLSPASGVVAYRLAAG